ncbi:MAG TPA: HlyD family efflux transporter periplasmic adaptor subunit [Thermoanaerobaculaceae bacterium]|nr:HlyD family efflux transporter periplasmic adaptor subunit [Thermoanaerobaculaceae bacterium]HPS78804.1 HlyD family efflux transporter periplasmic adaptor subunit [Thermoanaerobaculaceae bacterium]
MDVPRVGVVEQKRKRRIIVGSVIGVVVLMVTAALARLKPAAPTVERATVWIGKVEQGEMLRQVRGSGTLVPAEVRLVPAETSGRVERRVVDPGATVQADSVILVLSNPTVEQEATQAQSELRIAQAELENLRAMLESQTMTLRSEVARIDSESEQARLQAEANQELAKDGLVSSVELKLAQARAGSLATRTVIEKERLQVFARSTTAQAAAQEAAVEQRRAMAVLRQRLLDSLQVRAGMAGVLQEVTVEIGQQVTPGMNLARVAEPTHLMARLRVPATQARDVAMGLPVAVDTRNGIVPGKVSRIDPAVREGTVTVDVSLAGELPRGARPDMNVDGTIEIEHLTDVVYVGRPAFGQEHEKVGLFRIEKDGRHASRVQVKLGRSSVNTIEVLDGLKPGDEVVLSDTSRWDDVERIRLN